jgi:hypothetical protein
LKYFFYSLACFGCGRSQFHPPHLSTIAVPKVGNRIIQMEDRRLQVKIDRP